MINIIFIYILTLFRLVHKLLTKRLFLSRIEYASSTGAKVSPPEFFLETYILFGEL